MPKLPGVSHQQAIRALEKAAFKVIRQSGHVVLSNGSRFVVVPRNNPINAFPWAESFATRASP
jgi:predicted RNA binding protein YcfA (HicA-like mRNA interferase family)